MYPLDQLKTELTDAREKRMILEGQLQDVGFCINVLQKEVAYRTI